MFVCLESLVGSLSSTSRRWTSTDPLHCGFDAPVMGQKNLFQALIPASALCPVSFSLSVFSEFNFTAASCQSRWCLPASAESLPKLHLPDVDLPRSHLARQEGIPGSPFLPPSSLASSLLHHTNSLCLSLKHMHTHTHTLKHTHTYSHTYAHSHIYSLSNLYSHTC